MLEKSLEQNREIALSFVRQMPGGTFDEAMFHETFTMWTAFSEIGKEKFFQICDGNKKLFKPGFTIHMLNSIAEGNFVAVEAVSDGQYLDGSDYVNNYLLVFDIQNGKIAKIREYMDTKLVADTMLPVLQERFNIDVTSAAVS